MGMTMRVGVIVQGIVQGTVIIVIVRHSAL
jgi:hypothetical protein